MGLVPFLYTIFRRGSRARDLPGTAENAVPGVGSSSNLHFLARPRQLTLPPRSVAKTRPVR